VLIFGSRLIHNKIKAVLIFLAELIWSILVLGQLAKGILKLDAAMLVLFRKEIFWKVLHGRILLNYWPFVAQTAIKVSLKGTYRERYVD